MNPAPEPLDKIPLKKALVQILFSCLCITGFSCLGLTYYRYVRDSRTLDPQYNIIAIVQTCNENEALKTLYLAELMDLSVDRPTNLYRFSSAEAKKKLLASPLIKDAEVMKIKPGTIYVDYILRKPVAYLADYTNTGIDEERVPIPFNPFFTPKRLPEIVLGLYKDDAVPKRAEVEEVKWGVQANSPQALLALGLLKLIQEKCCSEGLIVCKIDVSNAYASSCGQREIIVAFEDRLEKEENGRSSLHIFPSVLRLSPDNYHQELANFLVLREYLIENEPPSHVHEETVWKAPQMVIDMRIPQLAFIAK